MKTGFARHFIGTLVFTGILTMQGTTPRALDVCGGGSGHGTFMLCADDYLYTGQYIVSPSEEYRMYFNYDGSTTVKKWNGSTYAHHYYVHGATTGTPGFLYFGGAHGWWFGALTAYDSSNQMDYIVYEPSSVQAEISARLENDGCIRFYEWGYLNYGPPICEP